MADCACAVGDQTPNEFKRPAVVWSHNSKPDEYWKSEAVENPTIRRVLWRGRRRVYERRLEAYRYIRRFDQGKIWESAKDHPLGAASPSGSLGRPSDAAIRTTCVSWPS